MSKKNSMYLVEKVNHGNTSAEEEERPSLDSSLLKASRIPISSKNAAEAFSSHQQANIDVGDLKDRNSLDVNGLWKKLNKSEKEKLELTKLLNEEVKKYETQMAKLRLSMEKVEDIRQKLEFEITMVKVEAGKDKHAAEKKMEQMQKMNEHLRAQNAEMLQRMSDIEKALEITKKARDEDQHVFESDLSEREKILQNYDKEIKLLTSEKIHLEHVLQVQENTLMELQKKLLQQETGRKKDSETLKIQATELEYSTEREGRLKLELENAMKRVKSLEESIESEREAHLKSKFGSEIIQLKFHELEAELQAEKTKTANAMCAMETVKKQLGELEETYQKERTKASDSIEKLHKHEKEHNSVKKHLQEEVRQSKARIAALTEELQAHKVKCAESQEIVETMKQQQTFSEQAFDNCLQEMELLLYSSNVSGLRTSDDQRDKRKPSNPAVILESLKTTLVYYQDRHNDASSEMVKLKQLCEKLTEEYKTSEETIWKQKKDIEATQEELAKANKELSQFHSQYADKEAHTKKVEAELQSMQQQWQAEKDRVIEAEIKLQRLTQIYQKDSEEKLTFLHGLYQRLVAGCVLIKQPEGLLGRFSWSELCAVLQEQADALTSDLTSANEKIAHLECVCETLKDLQKRQEDTVDSLTQQMKAQEDSWLKQKKEMELRYSSMIGELHTKAQKYQEVANVSKERVLHLEKTRDQMTFDLAHFHQTMPQLQKEKAALLSGCALLAGALYPLYTQLCVLSSQKDLLQQQVSTGEKAISHMQTLIHALTTEEDKEKEQGEHQKTKLATGLIKIFRKGVIVILAAHRFLALGQSSSCLFTWAENFQELPEMMVCVGGKKLEPQLTRQNKEHRHTIQALRWLTSSDLHAAVVSATAELHEAISNADTSSSSSSQLLISATRRSFFKLMDRLSLEMHNCNSEPRRPGCAQKGTLIRRLAEGLQEVNSKMLKEGIPVTAKQTAVCLQQHILEFTRRLHAAEVERRNLRLELKRNLERMKMEEDKALSIKASAIPRDKFENICTELDNALQREQQAQQLLREQAEQLDELGQRLEQHTGEEAEKDHTLSEAVKSLSEAKMELRRKDQSVRQLRKQLSQRDQDIRRLEENIHDAESALCTAAKCKEILATYLKSINANLKEVKDQISLSWSAATRHDFTLQLPKLHLEIFGADGLKGGAEVAACQDFVTGFMDLYQLACLKICALETEILSHQKNIAALKSELQNACLRENEEFLPVHNAVPSHLTLHSDKLPPEQDFAALNAEPDYTFALLRETSGNNRARFSKSSFSSSLSASRGTKRL
ncbi:coiled-coil domain-containing protein 171-like [Polypterus senegalus]|uniref:coiled-coil domain-containing protein 171-like n=1 Tax=Polypterus senegalus TaxID=55291 RepID=UPI001963E1C1|nr:coiled-coil domain-containing protein 171-like [Polypterus senegalus]